MLRTPAARRQVTLGMSVTIVDIAKRAKVAPSTVSRALSGKGRIAEKTRNRIVQIAQEMGYEVASDAPSPRAVGILYSRRLRYLIGDGFYGAVMEGVELSFRSWGYRVFFSTFERPGRSEEHTSELQSR